jgi:hypothetical protein
VRYTCSYTPYYYSIQGACIFSPLLTGVCCIFWGTRAFAVADLESATSNTVGDFTSDAVSFSLLGTYLHHRG